MDGLGVLSNPLSEVEMKKSIIFLLAWVGAWPSLAQWEHVDSSGNTVAYEQRLYRDPQRGIPQPVVGRTYIPRIWGVPLARFTRTDNGWDVAAVDQPTDWSDNARTGRTHRWDFSLLPTFTAQFGNFNQPIESKTTLLLQTHVVLAKGLQFQGSVVLPLQNSLDGQPNEIRFGPSFLNYLTRIGSRHFVLASAGYFYTDQYGVNVQYRNWSPTRRFNWGAEVSQSGTYFFFQDGQYHGPLDQLMALGYASYRLPRPDVTLQVIGGQFLFGDRGVRAEMIRQFTHVDVGFWGAYTRNGATVGFHLAVPLFPAFLRKAPVLQGRGATAPRLRMSEEFRWEYNYTRGFQIAERYRLGFRLDERLRMYERRVVGL